MREVRDLVSGHTGRGAAARILSQRYLVRRRSRRIAAYAAVLHGHPE